MRTLLVQLPLAPSSTSLEYPHALVQAETWAQALSLQWAVASLLPAAERATEVVAVLPAAAVSWHRVDLPPGLHKQSARLPAVLQGLLEDRLLDDPSQLHMALQTGWKDNPRPWVAVCDRTWLSAHLQALEQAGLTVHRIVPELNPASALAFDAQLQLTALGDAGDGWLWMSHPERGVWGHALAGSSAQALSLAARGILEAERPSMDVQAEPGVVALVSEILATPARLMSPAQHWQSALASDWDLAQFDFQANARSRYLKTWQRGASSVWRSATWRPLRWGLALLLASQLIGLNAWAWKTRADWQTQQQSWAQSLRATFPKTQVVVDAPLQMAREVERLRQASGQLSPSDLEAMLNALGQALPQSLAAPGQWAYQPGQLRLQGFHPSNTEQQALQSALAAQGYNGRADGDAWLMTLAPAAQLAPPASTVGTVKAAP